VEALKANRLGPVLGIDQKYLSRMANPNDHGAHFRARDLIPAMAMACQGLDPDIALGPLQAQAHALGHALYPLPAGPVNSDVITNLSRASRRFGDLGEFSIAAIDPAGEGGHRITAQELAAIQRAGFALAAKAASVVAICKALHRSPRPA
jgi:hypothetical protein